MNSDNVEATPLKFRLNLSDEQVVALFALLQAETVDAEWRGNKSTIIGPAIPLSKIKELFDVPPH